MRRSPFVVLCLLATCWIGAAWAGGDWNDAQIAWMAHEEGLRAASATGKPICLVFYTEWCPHCTTYSAVFHDARVVEAAKAFVMVRVERDAHRELSARHAPDGEYIPRTYFLSPDGRLEPTLQAPRESFKYFYDTQDPAGLLDGMQRALAALRPAPAG